MSDEVESPHAAPSGFDRRRFLVRAGVGTAVVWAAPSVTTLGPRALAAGRGSGPPGSTTADLYSSTSSDGVPGNGFTAYEGTAMLTGGYAPLGNAVTVDGGPHGVGGSEAGNSDVDFFPFFASNTGGDFSQSGYTVPAHSIDVHPGQSHDVIIGYALPDGTTSVGVDLTLRRNDNGSDGTGVGYLVFISSTVLASGVLAPASGNPTATYNQTTTIPSTTGVSLYVVTSNNGNYNNDSTGVALTVTTS